MQNGLGRSLMVGIVIASLAACIALGVLYVQANSSFGQETERVTTLDEALSDELAWTDSRVTSPDGKWSAVIDTSSTISIRSKQGSNTRILLTQVTLSDLIFTDIAWINNDSLAFRGQYNTVAFVEQDTLGDYASYIWHWRKGRIVYDSTSDTYLKLFGIFSITLLVVTSILYWAGQWSQRSKSANAAR